jgi:hypothetical protein
VGEDTKKDCCLFPEIIGEKHTNRALLKVLKVDA